MSLDTLYGAGAAAGFASRMDISGQFPGVKATVLEWANPDGSVGVEVKWATAKAAVARYRLVYSAREVFCPELSVEPGFRGKGVLTQLCAVLNAWWPTLGITRNTMVAAPGGDAERLLRLAGFLELPGGSWGCELPSVRLTEAVAYAEAKKAGQSPPEPVWRQGLPAPAEQVF